MNDKWKNYDVFVLGFDLLHDEVQHMTCDEAYEYCYGIVKEFYLSPENADMSLSGYDAMKNFLKRTGYIN